MKTMRIRPTTPLANTARTRRKNPRRTTQTSSPRNRPRFGDILVPIDFSPGARQALAFAVPLARQFKGGITLLHVVESRLVPEELSFLSMESDRRITAARRKLDALARKAVPGSLLKKTLVTAGRPFEVITHTAQGLRMDAIVIATHGRVGVKRLLLGSTAERVVRHSPCPVLTVRLPEDPKSTKRQTTSLAPRINRILVPVTFSEPAVNLTRYAVALARTMRARLGFLHIVRPLEAPLRVDSEKYYAEASDEARRQLGKIAASIPEPIKTEILLRRDIPHLGITRTAREWRADLILLSTHGRTGFEYLVFGSTAEGVVRHAPCAVLTIGRS